MAINNPQNEVTLNWDRPRHLRISYNSLALAEERAQLDGFRINLAALNPAEYGLRGIRVCLWAGLVHEDKQITPERVGELIDEFGLADSVSALAAALRLAFPKKKAETANPPQPEEAPANPSGIGTISSPLPAVVV